MVTAIHCDASSKNGYSSWALKDIQQYINGFAGEKRMSREIKFRLWDDGCRLMIYNPQFTREAREDGVYFTSQNDININDTLTKGSAIPHVKLVWLQYTGLKDSTGTEIYEGDIVNYKPNYGYDDAYYVVKFGEHMTSSDFYASAAYGFYLSSEIEEEREMALTSTWANGKVEIISNIYENRDLIC